MVVQVYLDHVAEYTTSDQRPYSYLIFTSPSDVYPKMYFARNGLTGDIDFSGTDASTVIQNAINALSEGTIFIKRGLYLLSNYINIGKSNIALKGEGLSTILKMQNGVNKGLLLLNKDGAVTPYPSNIVIENLTLDHNGQNQTAGSTLYLDYANDVIVRNCVIMNGYNNNIRTLGSSENPVYRHIVEGNYIKTSFNSDNVMGLARDSVYRNNIIEDTKTGGAMTSGGGRDVLVEGNIFINNLGYAAISLERFSEFYRVSICNNILMGNSGSGIRLASGSLTAEFHEISIIGNIISDQQNISISARGLINGVIEGNVIKNSGNFAINISGENTFPSNHVIISNNVIENSYAGINVTEYSKELCIVGNSIKNAQRHGIFVRTGSNSLVCFNRVINPSLGADNTYDGIQLANWGSTLCTNTLVQGNIITSEGDARMKYGINENSGSSAVNRIIHNLVSGAVTANIRKTGMATIVKWNSGYITENSGAATITAGATYVDVLHGLDITPDINRIKVTPKDNLGSRSFWVSDVGATTFRINISSTDTVDHAFGWSYE